jgi:oxalate decarboxylase/phosphoglucose isomerase-like protein (cupin superfamily)
VCYRICGLGNIGNRILIATIVVFQDEERMAVLKDFEQFVQSRGSDLHKYQDTDIVQCGLQEHKSSYVYKRALQIAKGRPNKLYLEFL